MDTAIWIHQNHREGWLVEVLPSLGSDPHAERPVSFNPGRMFRHPLNLIAANSSDLKEAILRDGALAKAIAEGDVLCGEEHGRELKAFAERSLGGHSQAG